MANKEPKAWITVNGNHIPIFEGESKGDAVKRWTKEKTGDAIKKSKEKKEEQDDTSYRITHRPSNPLEYPDEVATVDKIGDGNHFPKDILDNPDIYFPDYNNFGDGRRITSILKQAQNNPDMEVTIYRGAPSGGTLHTGDWVSLSKKYAEDYAHGGNYSDNENSKVYEYKVKVRDLSFDGDSFYEFGYWGKKLKK